MRFSAEASQILVELSAGILITAWGLCGFDWPVSLLPRDALPVDLSGQQSTYLRLVAAVLVGTANRNLRLTEVFVAWQHMLRPPFEFAGFCFQCVDFSSSELSADHQLCPSGW